MVVEEASNIIIKEIHILKEIQKQEEIHKKEEISIFKDHKIVSKDFKLFIEKRTKQQLVNNGA